MLIFSKKKYLEDMAPNLGGLFWPDECDGKLVKTKTFVYENEEETRLVCGSKNYLIHPDWCIETTEVAQELAKAIRTLRDYCQSKDRDCLDCEVDFCNYCQSHDPSLWNPEKLERDYLEEVSE